MWVMVNASKPSVTMANALAAISISSGRTDSAGSSIWMYRAPAFTRSNASSCTTRAMSIRNASRVG